MFNVAVIRLKDLLKFIISIIVITMILLFTKKIFSHIYLEKMKIGQRISDNASKYAKSAMDIEIPGFSNISKQNEENADKENEKMPIKMLNSELGFLKLQDFTVNIAKENEDTEIKNEEVHEEKEEETQEEKQEEKKDEEIELAKTEVKTEVVTENPLSDTYTKKYKTVKIKNETNFEISDEDLENNNLEIDKSNIIIFHTHTCESYTMSDAYNYTPTGNFRTTDLNYSVARVGDELTKYLEKYSIKVTHDKTYHDYPAYNGSYSRSLKTVTNLLNETKADIIIDIHRDAIGSKSSYAPTVKIGDEYCAQLMFVMGSNGGGLNHPNWKNNLQFAVKIQEIAEDIYPGLFKPIILRNSRYNQHLGKAACIIEVGSTGNTLEQCLNSMKYLAKIINEF